MRKYFTITATLGFLMLMFWGCHPMSGLPIRKESLIIQEGSRILICEAVQGFLGFEIQPFRHAFSLPGPVWVKPPVSGLRALTMTRLVKEMTREGPVNMVLVIQSVLRVEREYNPYLAFKGFQKKTYRESIQDGRNRYRTIDEPVFETEYRNRCTRNTYRVYQYDGDGEFLGTLHIKDKPLLKCPEATLEDIKYDEIDRLVSWLHSNISIR